MCKFLTWHAITRIFQIKRKTCLFGDAKHVIELWEKLPRPTKTPPMITMDEEEEENPERGSGLHGTLDLNFDAGGS